PESQPAELLFTAVDADLPAQSITFSLESGPEGAVIDATTGNVRWTPDEQSGPGSVEFIVKATDNGQPSLARTLTATIPIDEINSPPAINSPSDIAVNELETWQFQIPASDVDVPANVLQYAIDNAPDGMTVDAASGVMRWIPSELQGPGPFSVTLIVTDSNPSAVNEKSLSTRKVLNVLVNEVNSAPQLSLTGETMLDELTQWSALASPQDSDIPQNSFVIELISGPTGLTLDNNGNIQWTPTEDQAPGEHVVSLRITDNGVPPLSSESSFTLSTREINSAPRVDSPTNHFAHAGHPFILRVNGVDSDIPSNPLQYTLVSGPEGSQINGESGQFVWNVPTDRVNSSEAVRFLVSDNGSPELNVEHTINIDIQHPLLITSMTLMQPDQISLEWQSIPSLTYLVEYLLNVQGSPWLSIPGAIQSDSNITSQIISLPQNADQSFFRIRQQQVSE
ncbi:MAG: cadherin repeat domain-containing protein, partial [Verrucomicrobia bacterium]|nr:cadherin repeat domain-containing protein [Verrucomicrobiota bacterium]